MRGGPAVEVRVLGDLEVSVSGRRVELPASKKTRALLAYLVLTGTPQLREHLCDLLWHGPDDPRAALRWSLTKLRGVLGARLETDRQRARFVAEDATCDALAAREALAGGVAAASTETLERVASSFRGELLEGLDLSDCFRWHEWCAARRESMRALRVEVLATLVGRHSNRPESALAFARQRLAIDALAEGAHVDVVRLLTALGRNREAGEQADACRRIMAQELGTKPSAALLAARVRAEGTARRGASEVPTVNAAAGADAPEIPLVGRNEELEDLTSRWRSARDERRAATLLVVGEPGIGKTRLVHELAIRASAEGAIVLRGRAFEAEMVRPYGPWIDALRLIAKRPEAATLADRLAPFLPEPGARDTRTAIDRTHVFEAVASLLSAAASASGCVVALDDLQWFDEASLALLHFVARAPVPMRIVFMCTARVAELEENVHAMRLLRSMRRDGRVHELRLGPLSAAATSAIARTMDARADAARVAAESGGNPLYAMELARALRHGEQATESLDALLAERMDRVESSARELLPWAAALGRGFRAEVLGAVAGTGDNELLLAVEELERRGLLAATAAGYDFAHDLLRAAAYRRLSSPRRRLVHGRIARVLSERAPSDPSLHGDVVHHAGLAGDHTLAARAALAAAQRCMRVFAHDEAARLVETGLAHANDLLADERVQIRVALLRVKVLSGRWLRQAEELDAELARAAAEARDAGFGGEAGQALHLLAANRRDRGDLGGAHESTLRAVDAVQQEDTEARGQQLARTAHCLVLIERDIDRARGMIGEAAALLPRRDEEYDWRWADALLGQFRDDPDAAARLEGVLAVTRRSQEHVFECECLVRLAQLALDRGEPARALAWCRELAPVAAKMTDSSEGAIADALEALARLASGVDGADAHLERALARLRDVDAKGMLAYVLVAAADLDHAAGRTARAEERASEALTAAETVQRRSLVASARASLAELALARGDRAGAVTQLDAVAADLGVPLGVSERVRARFARLSGAIGR